MGKYLFLYPKTSAGPLVPGKAEAEKIKNAVISNGVDQVSDYILDSQ